MRLARAVVVWAWAAACARDDIPRAASGPACESTQTCRAWGCACADGTRVVARHCINLRCTTNDEACTDACREYGGWTRGDAGLVTCGTDGDCPAEACDCVDGTQQAGRFCPQGECAPRGLACANACSEHVGWAGCIRAGASCGDDPTSCCTMMCEDGACTDRGAAHP